MLSVLIILKIQKRIGSNDGEDNGGNNNRLQMNKRQYAELISKEEYELDSVYYTKS